MQTISVSGRVYNYSHCVGRNAVSGAGFHYPNALARGDGDIIYVVNQPDELQPVPHITKITVGSGWHEEEHVCDFGKRGSDDGSFVWPSAVALDSAGRVFIADEWLHRISIFDGDGNFLGKWGTAGAGRGQLNGPTGLAFDSEDNLYVTEILGHRVQKFTSAGEYVTGWGGEGTDHGRFTQPWGVAVDSEDNVYVADWHNDRVEKFSNSGAYLATIGVPGDDQGQVRRPSDVAVDKDGDVYVADWWNHKIEVYDPEGSHVTTFVGDAERLSKWAQTVVESNPDAVKARLRVKSLEPEWRFTRPTGVDVGDDGRIMVVESQRMRVQIYQKEENWVEPQFNL